MRNFLRRWAGSFLRGMVVLVCVLLGGGAIFAACYGLYLLVGVVGLVAGVLVSVVAVYTLAVTVSQEGE